ncbi:Transcription factor AbaA [Taphrina deformans PYCC 5710]|uniref:Transcription factor AbaA n=1 Tax=Taphrina deformans (strain PYCC 5710 / ATCC 11124 / CBS 356.35 / IMI 108563 / JCM 9778 / NBRC 8474) TaxID=1097556 RepID=R4XFZ4_TAPDE|nr:Transcription factor AbaA [Taphrina deformans PYCC 5710]|eukprot:CCG83419.1 Transcription factor AbaA [Taphrina deformans PYCC 5710]
MSVKSLSTPARTLLPSPIEKTPPSSTRKRVLNELSINLPPRPHSAQEFTTPEHPNSYKRYRKVSEPLSATGVAPLPLSALKRESPTEDSVWGPEVEAAFMSAIKSIPKLGRRKICIGSKPCGRNELIADFIYRRTGKVRTRKQVSSHIQVLKHIRRDDTEFLALVADGKDEDLDTISPKFDARDMEKLGSIDRETMLEQDYRLSLPLEDDHSPLGKVGRLKLDAMPITRAHLQLDEFCIWATRSEVGSSENHVSHVYTTFQKNAPIAVAPIDAVSDWALRFPCLPQLVADQYSDQCPVYHLRASMNLPETLDLEGEQQVVLRTQLSMAGLAQRSREQWYCITRVYTMGNKVLELKQKVNKQDPSSTSVPSGVNQNQGPSVAVPFATDFWAAFLAGLATLDQSSQNMSPEEMKAKRDRDSYNAVSGITVVQEIATMETSLESSKRLNVLIWEFTKTRADQIGSTVVTRIVLPDAQPEMIMQAPSMARTMSQPQSLPRKKIVRPKLSTNGVGLQRSQSMAAVPVQAYSSSQPPLTRPLMRQVSGPVYTQVPQQSSQNVARQSNSIYYQPPQDHQLGTRQLSSSANPVELAQNYSVPTQNPASYAMARSYSAPSWPAGTAPTQYPSSLDTGIWNDNFIDWSLPESAGYLQSDFQVASDDFFSATPSRSQSTIPQSFGMEHTTSTAGTEIDDLEDSRMPQLGFFPLTTF